MPTQYLWTHINVTLQHVLSTNPHDALLIQRSLQIRFPEPTIHFHTRYSRLNTLTTKSIRRHIQKNNQIFVRTLRKWVFKPRTVCANPTTFLVDALTVQTNDCFSIYVRLVLCMSHRHSVAPLDTKALTRQCRPNLYIVSFLQIFLYGNFTDEWGCNGSRRIRSSRLWLWTHVYGGWKLRGGRSRDVGKYWRELYQLLKVKKEMLAVQDGKKLM